MANTLPRTEEKRISSPTVPGEIGWNFLVSTIGLFIAFVTAYNQLKYRRR